jgi:type II secretory pathway pseudopilin PulG
MPPSTPEADLLAASAASQRRRSGGRKPTLLADRQAVSEVLGFMLIFGIISMILVISMLAFTNAQADAKDRVVGLQAKAAADRVASLVIEASLFAERQGPDSEFSYLADLPERLEGESYSVRLTSAGEVVVDVDTGEEVTAQLLQAGGGSAAAVCAGPAVAGGPLFVRFGDHDQNAVTTHCIFLEESQ